MDKAPRIADGERFLNCPKCNAVAARTETLGRSVVYVRCGACGEAWTINERRTVPRKNVRAPGFPPRAPD